MVGDIYIYIPGPWFDVYFLVSPKKRRRDQKHNTGWDSTKNITPKDQKHNTKAPKYNTKAQKYDTKVVSCPFFCFRPKIQRHQKNTSFRWSRYTYIITQLAVSVYTITPTTYHLLREPGNSIETFLSMREKTVSKHSMVGIDMGRCQKPFTFPSDNEALNAGDYISNRFSRQQSFQGF